MSGTFDVDVANLMACSSEPLDSQKLCGSEREDYLHQLALKGMKALAASLFEIPAEPVEEGRIIELPKSVTKLPREKPIPAQKAPTTWEKFAAAKGIQKKRRDRLVYDETHQDWRPRYGRNRANDESKEWAVVHKEGDDPTVDPWTRMKAEKKERVQKNANKKEKNLQLASGDRLPGTIDLAAAAGRLNKRQKKGSKQKTGHVDMAFQVAANSTASMGTFDKRSSNLEPETNVLKRSRTKPQLSRKQNLGNEKSESLKLLGRVLNKSGDNAVVLNKDKSANLHQQRSERQKRRR